MWNFRGILEQLVKFSLLFHMYSCPVKLLSVWRAKEKCSPILLFQAILVDADS